MTRRTDLTTMPFSRAITRAAVAVLAAGGLLAAPTLTLPAQGAETQSHALSLIGKPQYAPDFEHFKWVNPDAPKGGRLRQWARGTFDSLNPFTFKGSPALGSTLLHQTMMETSLDEPGTEYCVVCEWVRYPDDYSSVTFKLRDGATFHDGSPITAEDVIWSLFALKKSRPGRFGQYYKNVTKGEETAPGEVTFFFDTQNNRELPQIVGQLYVLSKAYWTGKDADGNTRDLTRSSSEVPVGSGLYKVDDVELGRSVSYRRVEDHWAADLPALKGQYNFDVLTWEYFRDETAAFEAFKSGQVDFWNVTSAKRWAQGFNFDAAKSGEIKREAFPVRRVAGMQAFVFNTRRAKFADPRVRRAFNHAFDFESANKNLFFGQYTRLKSFFDNSELASSGLPEGRELEILDKVRDQVPPEVFTTEWKNPTFGSPTALRQNLREASQLLRAAGWTPKGRVLTNAKGERFEVEFLLANPLFERIVLPFVQNLKRLGVDARVRVVDVTQYQRRTDTFDFDIIVDSFGQSFSPGNEQRDFWGSEAADQEGSRNTIGIKDPAVDAIIDEIIFAKSREDLVAATRALDRVLLWGHYVVPQWYLSRARTAWWDRFAHPDPLPSLAPAAAIATWWAK